MIRHAKSVACNQLHVHETTNIKLVTCPACKRLIAINPEIKKQLEEEYKQVDKVFKTKQKFRMPWGIHKGKLLNDIPISYLRFISTLSYAPASVKKFVKETENLI